MAKKEETKTKPKKVAEKPATTGEKRKPGRPPKKK